MSGLEYKFVLSYAELCQINDQNKQNDKLQQ